MKCSVTFWETKYHDALSAREKSKGKKSRINYQTELSKIFYTHFSDTNSTGNEYQSFLEWCDDLPSDKVFEDFVATAVNGLNTSIQVSPRDWSVIKVSSASVQL